MARVDLLEAQATIKRDGRLVLRPHLRLHHREILVVQEAEDIAQQQPAHSLPAHRLVDEYIDNADGRLVPDQAERLHLPDAGMADVAPARLFLDTEGDEFKRPVDALVVPPPGPFARHALDIEALAQRREAA